MQKVFKVLLLVTCITFSSCATCRRSPDTTVLDAQKQADRLEEGIRTRDRAIESCLRELEVVTRRSETMGGDIDDIIELLDLYYTTIQRLLRTAGYCSDEDSYINQDLDKLD